MVEQLVGRCLEQGYMEAQESLQIDSMRAQQVYCQFMCPFLPILFTFRFKRTVIHETSDRKDNFSVAVLPWFFCTWPAMVIQINVQFRDAITKQT